MKRIILALILSLSVLASPADEKQRIPSEHIYGPLLGKRVELDALAWDRGKGISGRVVLPSGDSVYVIDPFIRRANGNYELRIPQGKLVRLVGVLTFEQVPPPKPIATNVISQGYQAGFSYMALALESFTIIDRAEHEFPQLRPK